MTPCGVLNDAISIYFADATLASAFVARWCDGAGIARLAEMDVSLRHHARLRWRGAHVRVGQRVAASILEPTPCARPTRLRLHARQDSASRRPTLLTVAAQAAAASSPLTTKWS